MKSAGYINGHCYYCGYDAPIKIESFGDLVGMLSELFLIGMVLCAYLKLYGCM
jgi:hypothetical protein